MEGMSSRNEPKKYSENPALKKLLADCMEREIIDAIQADELRAAIDNTACPCCG